MKTNEPSISLQKGSYVQVDSQCSSPRIKLPINPLEELDFKPSSMRVTKKVLRKYMGYADTTKFKMNRAFLFVDNKMKTT
jgi:hypothetical protein